jgi:hypothetical protein
MILLSGELYGRGLIGRGSREDAEQHQAERPSNPSQ